MKANDVIEMKNALDMQIDRNNRERINRNRIIEETNAIDKNISELKSRHNEFAPKLKGFCYLFVCLF